MEIKLNKQALNSTHQNYLIDNNHLLVHTSDENISKKLKIKNYCIYNSYFELPEKLQRKIKKNKLAIKRTKKNISLLQVVQKTLQKTSFNLKETKEDSIKQSQASKSYNFSKSLKHSKKLILKIDSRVEGQSKFKTQLLNEINYIISNLSIKNNQINTHQEKLEKIIQSLSILVENLESINMMSYNLNINSKYINFPNNSGIKQTA